MASISVDETMRRVRPPEFADLAGERRHRLERLAVGFRVLARRGLTTGSAGHISARDPEFEDRFWVNPLSMPFSKIRVSDLVEVDATGQVVDSDAVINAAAFAIHSRIHARNPRVVSACHSHSPWGRPWSATGRLVEPTSQDACAFYEAQVLIGGFTGVVLGLDVGDAIGEAFARPSDESSRITVGVHANHGHVAVGETVDEAVFWFVLYEQVCESQMRLESTGRPYEVLDHEVAAATAKQVGTPYAGWLGFQSMCTEILMEEPDVLD
jgi:ribulose-5-phosphate 4-epimerase/fuculose-1-phosphate aldolase